MNASGGKARKRAAESAGLLLFRRRDAATEVFLAHPGGPFWSRRDAGAWTIPKGEPEAGEALEAAARREFQEETGVTVQGELIPLGSIRQKAGKVVHAWAAEGDVDPENVRSNEVSVEWPRGSGRVLRFPEIDRCGWFVGNDARRRINPAQAELLDRLAALIGERRA